MSDLEGFGFVMPHWFYWGWLAVDAADHDRNLIDVKSGKMEEDPHNHPLSWGRCWRMKIPVIHHHVKRQPVVPLYRLDQ